MSKNANSIKCNKTESPKTPGGISISLLTPCRRVGLSRSWRNKGPSPFISPLSSSQRNTDEEPSTTREKTTRKRKKSPVKDGQEDEDDNTSDLNSAETDNSQTPTRTNVIRKRSKTLLSKVTQSKCEGIIEGKESELRSDDVLKNCKQEDLNAGSKISRLSRNNSKVKSFQSNPTQATSTPGVKSKKRQSNLDKTKNVSPQNLSTECVVVIQKEIFKDKVPEKVNKPAQDPEPSQGLFDSDSDDIPLCQLNKNTKEIANKTEVTKMAKEILHTNSTKENNDRNVHQLGKLVDKKTSTTDLKTTTKMSKLSRKNTKAESIKMDVKPSSQGSFDDDDDDDDFDHRRTIVVRKSYDKVAKPLKAKSTGSITDKDIEELKNRIEVKKKLLLAKCLDSDTRDLRDLIKKWQRGCQDALVELMELMKKKMPDQPNMENAKILEMLKIPADLVGYDSENDCFNSPNDTNIILSSLKI